MTDEQQEPQVVDAEVAVAAADDRRAAVGHDRIGDLTGRHLAAAALAGYADTLEVGLHRAVGAGLGRRGRRAQSGAGQNSAGTQTQ